MPHRKPIVIIYLHQTSFGDSCTQQPANTATKERGNQRELEELYSIGDPRTRQLSLGNSCTWQLKSSTARQLGNSRYYIQPTHCTTLLYERMTPAYRGCLPETHVNNISSSDCTWRLTLAASRELGNENNRAWAITSLIGIYNIVSYHNSVQHKTTNVQRSVPDAELNLEPKTHN